MTTGRFWRPRGLSLKTDLLLCRQNSMHSGRAILHAPKCRTFISIPSLPKFPNILNPLASIKTTKHYKDRKLLKYSQQEFYNLVANVDDYQNFLPWCSYSKMSDPLGSSATQHNDNDDNDESDSGKVTVRHGELGIGFNAFQERYVSTVTSQAPWTVKAVSYDSKLFKELSTTWKFTPNVPKSTTLEAGLDQEVKERKLLIRTKSTPALQELDVDDVSQYGTTTTTTTTTSPASDPASEKVGSLSQGQPAQQLQSRQPRHFFTAAAVFGASALPYPTSNFESLSSPGDSSRPSSQNYPSGQRRTTSPSEHSPPQSSTLSPTPMPTRTLMTTPKTCTPEHDSQARTSSPSNLGTMKPCDYPSVWVDFEIEFEFASPVHASMSSMFFDQVSKEMLSAFIQRAQVLYGPR